MTYPKVRVSFTMKARARSRARRMGALKNSFMEGSRNVSAFIGEEVFQKACPEAKQQDTYDYDFIVGDQKVDVKTRTGTKDPSPDFDMVLPLLKEDGQDVDFYVFVQVAKDKSKAWLLGTLTKKELWDVARFVRKGDPMPQGGRYKSTGWLIYVGDMNPW